MPRLDRTKIKLFAETYLGQFTLQGRCYHCFYERFHEINFGLFYSKISAVEFFVGYDDKKHGNSNGKIGPRL